MVKNGTSRSRPQRKTQTGGLKKKKNHGPFFSFLQYFHAMWRKTIIRLFNRLTRFSLIVHYLLKLCITSHLFWLRSDFGPL